MLPELPARMKTEHTVKTLKKMRRSTCYGFARGLINTIAVLLCISSVLWGLYLFVVSKSLWPLLVGIFSCMICTALSHLIAAIFDLADAAILTRMDRARDELLQSQANQNQP
jgi:hypothetical protein